MNNKQFVKAFLASLVTIVVAMTTVPISRGAQINASDVDAAIANLAFQIAGPLEKAKAKHVIVADLLDADGKSHAVGGFLAEKLSAVLSKQYPELQTIPFSHSQSNRVVQADEAQVSQETRRWAKNMGAKVVITGSFGRVAQGIGITLMAMKTGSNHIYAQTGGVVPLSDEIAAVSTEPIAAMIGRIARAGVAGVTVPTCVYCPVPSFSQEARAANQGTVVLRVVITTEGVATNIVVMKGPGNGLEQKAIEAVKSWRFRPALGPDGRPVATIVPIEVTFRLR